MVAYTAMLQVSKFRFPPLLFSFPQLNPSLVSFTSLSIMAETLSNIALSDLIGLAYPVNGTASLQPSSTSRPFKRIKLDRSLLSHPNPSRKTFTPISRPVLLVGTVNFFSEPFSQHSGSCLNHCLSFSDSSSAVCCYILDFDPRVIGREIHVMAWNYLPVKQGHSQGVLEIIQWRFPSPNAAPCRDFSLLLSLSQDSGVTARSAAFGMLKSVSLIFTLPIDNGKTSEMDDSVGFLAEILTCLCDNCAQKHSLIEKNGLHHFTESKVVYFTKPSDQWRPLLAKLVGKVMYLKGLKKKLVVVGNESYVMLVSTIKTKVSLCASVVSDLPFDHFRGAYRGIVTGIYLHGMIVELDEKVWLLIHDTLLVPWHSLRIGAIVSIRNFHMVCARFAWTNATVLGTCVMTSLHIDSFAFSETKVFAKAKEKSALGKFVESLKLSAKFWVLLTVSCFKGKFRTVLSDKELLGSNNSAGLVQAYTNSYLPPDVFQPRNSMFTMFCKHDGCTYGAGHDQTKCKLVVPLSNFVGRCEELWISIQSQMSGDSEICCNNTCDGVSYPGFIRRIIPSDDFGCILMGNIQTCSLSGKLQLIDATGNVDVVISGQLSDLNVHTIYEVRDYRVVLEGFIIERDTSVYDFGEPLSCNAIFKRHTYKKRMHDLVFYIQFHMKSLVCLNSPSHVPSNLLYSAHNAAHLLVISHKFPFINNFSINTAMSRCSSSFAEALVFPCKFKFSESGELIQLENGSQNVIDIERVPKRNHKKVSEKGQGLSPTLYSHSGRNRGASAIAITEFDSDAKPLTRILLEFKCENLFKYQLLQIGSYHLLNCSEGSRQTRICKCLEKRRNLTVDGNTLLSLSLSSSHDVHQTEPCQMTLDEVQFLKPLSELPVIMDLKYVSQGISKLVPLNQVLSVSSCMQLMFNRSRIFSGSTDIEGQRLAQGVLISVCGNIEAFHVSDYDAGSFSASNHLGNSNQREYNICIHLADDYHMVVVRGNLSKTLYPVGIGIGARATFHRLLLTFSSNRKERLLLTPVTYIEITSVREIKTREPNKKMFRDSCLAESLNVFAALGLFSDLHESDSKVTRFNSRVLTLNVLMLENCASGSVSTYQIPLAGFVLDDGSAVCNCWTDGDQACTLLNLPNICSLFFSSDFSSLEKASTRLLASCLDHRSDKNGNSKYTIGYFLMNMLKKHHKVTVKNHGISLDISGQDLSFHSSSGKAFSILEERLLNYIVLNSCQGPTFSVNGLNMDANAMERFHTYSEESENLRGCAPNIWIAEVSHIDPLKDAFNILHDIRMRYCTILVKMTRLKFLK